MLFSNRNFKWTFTFWVETKSETLNFVQRFKWFEVKEIDILIHKPFLVTKSWDWRVILVDFL